MIYDITRTIRPDTAVWPGDAPYSVAHPIKLVDGAPINLTTLTLSPHIGTHADAYYHYVADGAHPPQMPLTAYIGKAHVVTVDQHDGALQPSHFEGLVDVERLLIRSHVSDLPDDQWPDEFPYLSVDLIRWLAAQGCQLIGLDSPSVDDFNSKDLPCRHALMQAGMVNLELLQLRDVPDGVYELIALPLRLDLACASPVRAVLRTL